MRNSDSFFLFLIFTLFAVPIVGYIVQEDPLSITGVVPNYAAASFLEESVNLNDLQKRYDKFVNGGGKAKDRINILIVPGHDESSFGTQFRKIKEVDLNRQLAEHIEDVFLKEKAFDVMLTADTNGYNKKLEKYLDREEVDIKEFEDFYKKTTAKLENNGHITLDQEVFHNAASSDVVFTLYGINKFANDEDFDIVIHIHFNDYPGRDMDQRGKYKGVSIYVPDTEFSNGRASREIATNIFERLTTLFSRSTNPVEKSGVIEDSELIAVGAFNTLDPVSMLIEYGYIYQPEITNPELRQAVLREMAYQTFIGIKSYFDPNFVNKTNQTLLIPYNWEINLGIGGPQIKDVLALETLLKLDGFFPGNEKTLADCPVDGEFDVCTEDSLLRFQNNYGLKATGVLDGSTRDFLNSIF